ncbi:glycoside hydrolase family 43 protein [Konateibacter massiliensis]|uniref:glycoside hydrolase family 43 protein n=1 Tax=Konateibacter massiliensis TaxID=2002841 RepID=UPI000C15E6D2|nr:glycoside hydrolase family 43 protein [Konateibacter massiliensis]
MFKNPIISGFYPDPSICRVEDDFYIVNSSFSYFPGIPIFHSRDLVNWRQLGHVLDRKSQLPLNYKMISGGIFAPTIRYHQGIYYVITTNMSMGCVNFVVTADNPAGPWSEMHIIEGADGIDPSLFFDEDGSCYYTGTTRFEENGESKQGIWCSRIDIGSFKLVGERKIIGAGAQIDAHSPEGPHIYKKDGWYYLMIAEGGTEHYHAVTISRSKEIFGPYENYQGNPILTHRHLGKNYPICNVGHGDLVELKDNSWYMVLLGSRLMDGYHKILGRETFLVPVTWEDGWPVIAGGKVEGEYPKPKLSEYKMTGEGCQIFEDCRLDNFDKENLGAEWNYLGTPYEEIVKLEGGFLKLKLIKNSLVPWEYHNTKADVFKRIQAGIEEKECAAFVGRRQQHMQFEAETALHFTPVEEEKAGIVILQNDANQVRLEVARDEEQKMVIRCVKVISHIDGEGVQHFKEEVLGEEAVKETVEETEAFTLGMIGKGTKYSFYRKNQSGSRMMIAEEVDCGFLGSETAGGFVGAYIGMFAERGEATKSRYARFGYFRYDGKK